MRAAILEQVGAPLVVRDDVEAEEPRAGEVAVRVSHCGVCHSDLSLVDGALPAVTPVILGHEAAGVVSALGPGVTRLAVGDHVVLTPCPPCGHCYYCVRGEWSICDNSDALATSTHPDGGTRLRRGDQVVYRGVGVAAFAETVIIQEAGAVKLDPDIPLDVACVIGCAVQTGVGAVLNTAGVEPGDTVLVMGLGGIGLSIVQGARLAGASQVIVSDPVAERRTLALELGATMALDPTVDDVAAACHDVTQQGVGVDYAFDALGRNSLIATGIDATRKGGTTVLVGVGPLEEALSYPSAALVAFSSRRVVGCLLGSVNSLREIPRLVALWQAGRLDLEALITHRRPLAEINDAFDDLRAARGVRTVLTI
ncbi:MAG: Zn-dependent alcohol dehydrogenase, class [Acidimicrobiales bacterium]|nr:Zn-dependent alcohol dehydrogenase, class [Acidimicrobiales bacterium]